MALTAVGLNVDGEHVALSLQEAKGKLDGADSEVVLDFSPVRRVDSNALGALEELARIADEKTVKVVLRGVSVDIYKALKLAKLTRRFSFVN